MHSKKKRGNFITRKSEELEILIKRAQHDDQGAIDELCKRFELLIYKEAYRSNIYNALGKDAVNIAWTIFLSFTRRYNGTDFECLPSLIQYHLYYELNHHVTKRGITWDNEVVDTETAEADTGVEFNPLQNVLLNIALYQELKKLSKRQLEIIWRYYFQDQSQEAIAKAMHCATRTVGYQRVKALEKLRKNMQ